MTGAGDQRHALGQAERHAGRDVQVHPPPPPEQGPQDAGRRREDGRRHQRVEAVLLVGGQGAGEVGQLGHARAAAVAGVLVPVQGQAGAVGVGPVLLQPRLQGLEGRGVEGGAGAELGPGAVGAVGPEAVQRVAGAVVELRQPEEVKGRPEGHGQGR